MNFLEKLLDGVAVKWKPLGELGEFVRGSGLQKSDFTDSGIGCIHYGQIYTFYGDYAYQTKSFVSSILATKLRKAQKNDLIIATTSENIEDVCKTLVWLGEEEVCVSGETYIFKHNQNPKYLAYCLKTPHFFDFKKRNRTGTKVIRVHGDRLATFQIPIPCPDNPEKSLAIQAEIVRILDTFTALTAELIAELTDRQKQYNYYRDRLLSFEKGEVEWKTLGEICEVGDGNHSSKYPKGNEMVDHGVPFIRGTNIVNGTISGQDIKYITPEKHRELRKGHLKAYDVLIANRGEIGKVAYIPKHFAGSNLNSQLAWLRSNPAIILPRYLFFVLNTTHIQNSISGEGGALQQLTIRNIKLISIPVPPLKIQAEIVRILDTFTDLTAELTAELTDRKKQYNYYCDLLLTFPKPEEVEAHLNSMEKSHG